jgi:uncharacterized protein (UPF0276 family)
VGVGFRVPHYRQVVEERPEMDWFECISENFMEDGGSPLAHLDALREAYPVVLHGVSANLGGHEDPEHSRRLARLCRRVDPPWVSDHVCWTGAPGLITHDLLPLPYTEQVVEHLARRTRELQDRVERPFGLENASSYATWAESTMTEWDFLRAVVEEADCGILLDVNNIFVSACNHGFDPLEYLERVPHERVLQIHLAGHSVFPTHRLDTHDAAVCDEVWALYRRAIELCGPISTLIEWDAHIPSFARLQEEADKARAIKAEVLAEDADAP